MRVILTPSQGDIRGLDSADNADHKERALATGDAADSTEDCGRHAGDVVDPEKNHDLNVGNDVGPNEDIPNKPFLPHAPVTSHGTYVNGGNHGLENLEYYEEGGYHPIHLGDYLGPNYRYRVIHKLGHGGFGTVWLCRDNNEGKYVAVKVMTADTPPDKRLDLSFSDFDRSQPGAEYIAFPLDHFEITGPNGQHHCVALPVLGPCASPNLWRGRENAGSVLRKMCKQAAEGLNFLHENGICHADFRPANILVQLSSLDHLSKPEIFALLGEPDKCAVRTESGAEVPKTTPSYLVGTASFRKLRLEYLTDKIMIIDFSEAFRTSSPPSDLGIPEHYLPPEVIFKSEGAIGIGCDIWALVCTLYEIRAQIPLFYMTRDEDDLLSEMACLFGKLPEPWWSQWNNRGDFFDQDGGHLSSAEMTIDGKPLSLEVSLDTKIEFGGHFGSEKEVFEIPADEQKMLADLLRKLCIYDPERRPSVREILQHEWFVI